MTAAIDRFLYRANADTVSEHFEDVAANLRWAVEDFAGVLEDGAEHDDLVSAAHHLVKRRDEILQAIDAAEHFLSDFIEANRP